MHAWGTGNFENDFADDWLTELCESRDFEAVMIALAATVEFAGTEDLEAGDCCGALAAAEMVAAAAGRPADALSENARRLLEESRLTIAPKVLALARKAVQAVKTRSSLRTWWKSRNALEEWLTVLDDLEERLRG